MKDRFQVGLFSFFIATTLVTSAHAASCTEDGFLPRNRAAIGVRAFNANGMTEAKFNAILDRTETFYRPVIAAKGGNFVVNRNWADATVNAYADRQGKDWIIKMYGGLARHDAITADGFQLIACHEVGHQLGGAPKVRSQWAANEGQADYYATLKCLRNLFKADNNVDIVKELGVPDSVTKSCEKSFGDANAIAICQRSAMAGFSAAKLMQIMAGSAEIDFAKPNPTVVPQTIDTHPEGQCRLDTYYGGAVCQVAESEPLSETIPSVGTCATETGATRGVRPLCWYRPEGGSPNPGPTNNPNPVPTNNPNPIPAPGGIARAPVGAGGQTTVVTNPYARVEFGYDTSEFPGAAMVWFEISAADRDFLEPNGTRPDPYRTVGTLLRGSRGGFYLIPARVLPGWGVYSVRVIPVDAAGNAPVGRFSNPARLILRPQR